MSDDQRGGGDTPVDVELGAALALADMAGGSAGVVGLALGPGPAQASVLQPQEQVAAEDEEAVSTRLSLELGKAEKEAKRLRRVLANRESARQTILRRQAVRDELARRVADLSSQNETMRKEKDLVMREYLSLKETNRQLRAQAQQRLSLSSF